MPRTHFIFTHIAAALSSALLIAPAQSGQPDPEKPVWNDLSVIHQGREDPRAFAFPFNDRDSAVRGAGVAGYYRSPNVKLLNGEWDFFFAETPSETPSGFTAERFQAAANSGWTTIPVPANIELHGFGFANYTNIKYHFNPAVPPEVPAEQNWVGCYRRSFEIPTEWDGREIFLRFEGAGSAVETWVNGTRVGYNQGGRASAEFNITEAIRPGSNTIAVKTYRLSDGSYVEDQDFWRLSGLYRDVLIWSAPPIHIEDFGVRTTVDEAGKAATIAVELSGTQYSPNAAADDGNRPDIHLELLDHHGRTVTERTLSRTPFKTGQPTRLHTELNVSEPALWTAETPNLYTLLISIKSGEKTIEVIPHRVGIREISIDGRGRFLINGKPVLMRGVNRHEHEPETGHAVTMEGMLEDVRLIKLNNFNAVRTCHYPNHPVWYELCNEHGLYVVDEANIESHGIGYKPDETLANQPEWTETHLDRFRRMVIRDRNFACIVSWSLGNEMGDGVATSAEYMWGKAFDPTRPVQSEQAKWTAGNTDMVVPMYAGPERIRKYAEEDENSKPLILCEYSHAMGNSNGNFDWYWDLFRTHDELGGGFIWDWADQGLVAAVPDVTEIDVLAPDRTVTYAGRVGENGGRGRLTVGNDEAFNIQGPLTLEAWIKTDRVEGGGSGRAANQQIIGKGDQQYALKIGPDGTLQFFVHDGSAWHVAKAPLDDSFSEAPRHVAGIYDGQTLDIYIDGQPAGSTQAKDIRVAQSVYPLSIGHNSQIPGRDFDGLIREARVYARALTLPEIRDVRAEADGLIAHVRLSPNSARTKKRDGADRFFAYGGFLEPTGTYNDDNFCMNGIVNADRRPKPAMGAIKHAQRPVLTDAVALNNGTIRVTSFFDHRMLDEVVTGRWSLTADGRVLKEGTMQAPPLSPRESGNITLDLPSGSPERLGLKPGEEFMLTVRWYTRESTSMVPAGHEVAWAQFAMPVQAPPAAIAEVGDKLSVDRTNGVIVVSNADGFTASIDASSGMLSSIQQDGHQLLAAPMQPHFWRAPVDNDRGNKMLSRQGSWRDAGPSWLCNGVTVESNGTGGVVIRAEGKLAAVDALYRVTYTIRGSGELHVLASMDKPKRRGVGELPRFGVRMGVAPSYGSLVWYGPGPDETTWDRDELPVGVWKSRVTEEYFPYSEPQETGTHVSTRWLALTDGPDGLSGRGLAIFADAAGCTVPDQALTFSAIPHSTAAIELAKYDFELKPEAFTWLTLDTAMMGVGGDNSWGAREKGAYRLGAKPQSVAFVLKPIDRFEDIGTRRGLDLDH